jgi:hypothetical protein
VDRVSGFDGINDEDVERVDGEVVVEALESLKVSKDSVA